LAAITLGHPLLDEYLAFVAARARINTWLAVASDLKICFGVVAKEPTEVTAADVFAFLAEQRKPRLDRVVRLEDGEAGLAARTIARRLSSVRGLYAYLAARGDTDVTRNPVPTSLAARRRGARRGNGGVPLIRTPRTLPRVLSPAAVDALAGALRTHRDRAMVDAMVPGGLRRCEMLGLRLEDVNAGQQRLFVAEGKGGRQRIVPVSARFFASLGSYLEQERPTTAPTERVFVVLKGPRRGAPLSAAGVDEILDGARARAGLQWATCHQLRHTCFHAAAGGGHGPGGHPGPEWTPADSCSATNMCWTSMRADAYPALRAYATKHPCHGFWRAWAALRYDERREVNKKLA
jgi:site-specific recombinase XerD